MPRTCDGWSRILAVRDKVGCTLALARSGLPVPPTFLAERPEDLEVLPARQFPLLLKPVDGDNARGIRVVRHRGELASLAWHGGLVLAQPYLDAGGAEVKLYVAGEAVWAVRRRSP